MLKKNFILITLDSNNNLHSTNFMSHAIPIYKKLIISIFLENKTHFLNLKNILC